MATATGDYEYPDTSPYRTASYLWPSVERHLRALPSSARRVFELGCGNGSFAAHMHALPLDVVAVDPSVSGIAVASRSFAGVAFHVASTDDDLADRFGRFPVVVSVEVVEHCYSPERFAKVAFDLLEPGGRLLLTTPFHGYWKNLALALTGKMDAHYTALWEGGHIKFFSIATITELLTTAGFVDVRIETIGRVPWLAKSMLVLARRPG